MDKVAEVNLWRAPWASTEKWAELLKQWAQSYEEGEGGREGEGVGEDSCF